MVRVERQWIKECNKVCDSLYNDKNIRGIVHRCQNQLACISYIYRHESAWMLILFYLKGEREIFHW